MDETTSNFLVGCFWGFSFIISFTVLIRFWKDDISRLAGFYAIKPVVHVFVFSFVSSWLYDHYRMMAYRSISDVVIGISYIVLEIILTLIIMFFFRYLYKFSLGMPWILLILDNFRWTYWGATWVLHNFLNFDYPEFPYYLLETAFFLNFIPVLALILGSSRNRKFEIANQVQGKTDID